MKWWTIFLPSYYISKISGYFPHSMVFSEYNALPYYNWGFDINRLPWGFASLSFVAPCNLAAVLSGVPMYSGRPNIAKRIKLPISNPNVIRILSIRLENIFPILSLYVRRIYPVNDPQKKTIPWEINRCWIIVSTHLLWIYEFQNWGLTFFFQKLFYIYKYITPTLLSPFGKE